MLFADLEAHGHTGGSPSCAEMTSRGRTIKPHKNECRERIRKLIEKTLTGKARINEYKDSVAETRGAKEEESSS